MQMDIDQEILYMVKNHYHLTTKAKQQLNRYFYFQGINTAAAYLVVWTQISLRKRLKETRLIMEDPRFIRFLEKQKQYGDIHKLDYILLKQKNYVVYYLVHFVYTYLKKWMHKEF